MTRNNGGRDAMSTPGDDVAKSHPQRNSNNRPIPTAKRLPAATARLVAKPVDMPDVVTADTWPGGLPMPNFSAWVLRSEPLVAPGGNRSHGYAFAKRTLDVVGASLALLLFAPLMIVTFLVLSITTRGKPLFRQERVGRCGRLFGMYKFRTMHVNAEALQAAVKNEKDGPIFKNRRDPRITRIGRILRSFSIDEMPQLFSVLKGDMSLVGPRPPIASEVMKYAPWQTARLSVTPGLTCLWQVSGRSEIGFEDWVKMDLWYIENQSLWTDLKLLARTPLSVLSRKGAY